MGNKGELFAKAVKSIDEDELQSVISITELFNNNDKPAFRINTINTNGRGQDMIVYLKSLIKLKGLAEDAIKFMEEK